LTYLGLGDWHGQMQIGAETWYSGAPEADGFKHTQAPAALLVEIAGPRAAATVTSLPTGSITWQRAQLDLTEGDDPLAAHERGLPALPRRALTLFDLHVTGHARALARVAVEQAAQNAAPDFLWHRADFSALGMVHDSTDLDAIDKQGALRAAAEALASDAAALHLPPEARATASAALSYLFSYALEA